MSIRFFLTTIIVSCFCITLHPLHAQMRVGQPAGSPDGSASLDVGSGPYSSGSQYRGIAPPKIPLTKTALAAPVTGPATGLLIYNTATQNDVKPGYYYWDSSKWTRLSTANSGAFGDPMPAYTYTEAKALTTPPGAVFMLTEPGQEGIFRNANTPLNSQDTLSPNGIRDVNNNIIASGTIMMVGGQRYMRVINDGIVNVKWFGAVGQSDDVDDAPAIQRAIDYAKFLVNKHGNVFNVATVLIPPGNFRIRKTLDLTKCNGIFIKGSGGRYMNSAIVGNTGGLMLDFTDSFYSGCENLFIQSWANEANPSTIGVQFALGTSSRGLTCLLKNCFIQMADIPSANNNIGTIGMLNCRAEEFAVSDCRVQANIGCIFTRTTDLNEAGLSYTVNSVYAPIATGIGSMGVVNFTGQNSLVNYGKAQPALVLNGTNSVTYHGYLGRATLSGSAMNDVAILATVSTRNLQFSGTVESFSQLIRIKGAFENSTINGVVANQINPALPVIDVQPGAVLNNPRISVIFGNDQAEIGSRYLVYTQPPNSPGALVTSQINGGEINCNQFTDNTHVVNPGLLKQCANVRFNVVKPFEKSSPFIKGLKPYTKQLKMLNTTVRTDTIARFLPADYNQNALNSGDYQIEIRGKIRIGWPGAGYYATAAFHSTIVVSQFNGTKNPVSSSTTILAKSLNNANWGDLTSLQADIKFSADKQVGYIVLTPTTSGSGTGDPIVFVGQVEIASDFQVNQSVLID